eukprot:SAG22_NODE_409_length_10939_cov_1.956638_1_plen_54_part_10
MAESPARAGLTAAPHAAQRPGEAQARGRLRRLNCQLAPLCTAADESEELAAEYP